MGGGKGEVPDTHALLPISYEKSFLAANCLII